MNAIQIIETTEVRRHNGQCAYGEWLPLADLPSSVQEAISDEIVEATCREMRREPHRNTDESGRVDVAGQSWLYRR